MAESTEPLANVETTDIQPVVPNHIESPEPLPAPETPEATPHLNRREEQMREIVANRKVALDKELGLGEAMGMAAPPDDQPEENERKEEPPKPIIEAKPEPVANPPAPPKPTFKIKVNGTERELSEDELLKQAQLGLASQERFQEAKRLRDEAEAFARAHQPVQPTVQPQPQPKQPLLDPGKAKEVARRLLYGNEDESAQALSDLVDTAAHAYMGRQPQGPTPDQIVQQAAQVSLQQQRHERNIETIAQEYSGIFQDQDLTLLAIKRVHDLANHYQTVGVQKSEMELYREACKHVQDRFAKPQEPVVSVQPPVQAAPPSDKVERKRAAPKPPAAANARIPMADTTPRPLTGAQIVDNMRKSRGQPTLMN